MIYSDVCIKYKEKFDNGVGHDYNSNMSILEKYTTDHFIGPIRKARENAGGSQENFEQHLELTNSQGLDIVKQVQYLKNRLGELLKTVPVSYKEIAPYLNDSTTTKEIINIISKKLFKDSPLKDYTNTIYRVDGVVNNKFTTHKPMTPMLPLDKHYELYASKNEDISQSASGSNAKLHQDIFDRVQFVKDFKNDYPQAWESLNDLSQNLINELKSKQDAQKIIITKDIIYQYNLLMLFVKGLNRDTLKELIDPTNGVSFEK